MGLDRDTTFTWYGHACVEIRTPGGKTILIDPWFGNPKSTRAAAAVDRCDVMLVTHGHSDHLGDAVAIASRLRPAWPVIHELSLWLGRNLPGGSDAVIGMNKGGTVEVAGLHVTMTRAEHSAGDWNAAAETTLYLGEPAGFVVELENGFRFYHAGDTTAFGDMRLIGDLYRPELAILPIGGHYTMGPREAALAVELLGVTHVLPIHYGTFPALTGTPEELRRALAGRGLDQVTVHAPQPGGSVS
jgi:L-ascorbate metabolism protein UlaG (beta-lactamase superfamily)